jgi:hypothetical protein
VSHAVVFRRRRAERSESAVPAVPAAYAPVVAAAERAGTQFTELVEAMAPGPLRDRVAAMQARVDAGVLAVRRSVDRAVTLERNIALLDPDRVTAELKVARREGADEATVATLAERFASTQRLLNALDDLRRRLPVAEARLGTAVARAVELSVLAPSASSDLAELARQSV